jgi:hypothetical protein
MHLYKGYSLVLITLPESGFSFMKCAEIQLDFNLDSTSIGHGYLPANSGRAAGWKLIEQSLGFSIIFRGRMRKS